MTSAERERLRKLPPLRRIRVAGEAIEKARGSMAELAAIRAEAVAELRDDGWTLERIAESLGISRQQVHRIARGRQ